MKVSHNDEDGHHKFFLDSPQFVIDGRIMMKQSNGKLQAVYASSNQSADVSAEEATKNDLVGGRVAPRLPIAVHKKKMQIIWT